jgi:hypothetical protein
MNDEASIHQAPSFLIFYSRVTETFSHEYFVKLKKGAFFPPTHHNLKRVNTIIDIISRHYLLLSTLVHSAILVRDCSLVH